MDYMELKEKHEREFDEFAEKNMFFAFSNEQLEEGLEKLNTTTEGIYSVGAGGFVLKSKSKDLHNLMDKFKEELSKHMENKEFAYGAFKYELANHEYVYTGDNTEILDLFDLCHDGLKEKNLIETYNKAVTDYLNEVEA